MSKIRRGGKIIAFVEARQGEVIRRLLEHFGLWQNPPSRAPPQGPWPPRPARSIPEDDPAIASGTAYEVDPDFLEHARREDLVQPDLPWDRSERSGGAQFRP